MQRIHLVVLAGAVSCAALHQVCAQGRFVEPTGFTILFRNTTAPIRYITDRQNNRIAANIHLTGDTLQFRLIIKGSDGRFYTQLAHPTATMTFDDRDGWSYHVVGSFPLHTQGRLTVVYDWDRIRREGNIRPQLEVTWYALDRSVVDRETHHTSTQSPDLRRVINGRDLIRYYLVKIDRSPGGGSWGYREITLPHDSNQRRGIRGNIIALIVCVSWIDSRGTRREVWIPSSNNTAPLPGLNDCSRRVGDRCVGSVSTPMDATFNQSYATRRWDYDYGYGMFYFDGDRLRVYRLQYPVYVMRDLSSRVPLPTSTQQTRRWRVYRSTIWENVPYEYGGKYFGARASGIHHSYRDANGNGSNSGFGLDCSGLIRVSSGVYNDPYYGVSSVWDSTQPTTWDRLQPGDVIIKLGNRERIGHVMLVLSPVDRGSGGIVQYIEAIGGTVERVRIHSSTVGGLTADGYSPRRFTDTE